MPFPEARSLHIPNHMVRSITTSHTTHNQHCGLIDYLIDFSLAPLTEFMIVGICLFYKFPKICGNLLL